jgi:DnaJ family protein B protein 12
MSAKASGADAGDSNGDARNRNHNDGSSGRAFTVEQKAAVIRVRRCGATAFYDILGLEDVKTTCTESEIKKAYRKQSLLTHPDKNGYDGAEAAFKMVSRAFQVLSDPEKKTKYDRFGGDPDSRQAAPASSPFNGFARGPGGPGAGGSMFDEEISPEELFRQFFGGGMGGGGFPGFGKSRTSLSNSHSTCI